MVGTGTIVKYSILTLSVLLFFILGIVFAQKAQTTKIAQGDCYSCWYQHQISVSAMMFLLSVVSLMLCCLSTFSNRVKPCLPSASEFVPPVMR